jgi:uncharacterized protein
MTTDTIMHEGTDVTVVVSRTVKPGNEIRYDRWVRRLVAAATEAPGNTGVTMLIPEPGKVGLYHVVFHFKDQASVDAWEKSERRQKLTGEADQFSQAYRQASTGLETWFTIPDCPHLAAPPHWKMFLITTLAVFIVSLGIIPFVTWLFDGFTLHIENVGEFFLESLVNSIFIVGILTWAVMPFFSRKIFQKWLYR